MSANIVQPTREQRKAELEKRVLTEAGFKQVQSIALTILGKPHGIGPVADVATLFSEYIRIILEHEFPADSPTQHTS
jgi:hypothetical protein